MPERRLSPGSPAASEEPLFKFPQTWGTRATEMESQDSVGQHPTVKVWQGLAPLQAQRELLPPSVCAVSRPWVPWLVAASHSLCSIFLRPSRLCVRLSVLCPLHADWHWTEGQC